MTYCVDFMRGIFYRRQPIPDGVAPTLHSPLVNLAVIAAFTALFLVAGTSGFVRSSTCRGGGACKQAIGRIVMRRRNGSPTGRESMKDEI
jgi:hypothetical protein